MKSPSHLITYHFTTFSVHYMVKFAITLPYLYICFIPFCYSINRTYARDLEWDLWQLKIGDEFSRNASQRFCTHIQFLGVVSRDTLGKLISCQRASQLATRITKTTAGSGGTRNTRARFAPGGARIRGKNISIYLKTRVKSLNFSFAFIPTISLPFFPFFLPFSNFQPSFTRSWNRVSVIELLGETKESSKSLCSQNSGNSVCGANSVSRSIASSGTTVRIRERATGNDPSPRRSTDRGWQTRNVETSLTSRWRFSSRSPNPCLIPRILVVLGHPKSPRLKITEWLAPQQRLDRKRRRDQHLDLSSSFRFTAHVHAKVNRINSSPCDLCSACMEQTERIEGRVERLKWRERERERAWLEGWEAVGET